jgi:hypothetical protein
MRPNSLARRAYRSITEIGIVMAESHCNKTTLQLIIASTNAYLMAIAHSSKDCMFPLLRYKIKIILHWTI